MSSKKSDDQKLADRANELYWRSKQSVNQIAETMDLSKSGLYSLIHPLPTDRNCPVCGQGLVFSNRTAEHKGIASCRSCRYEGSIQPDEEPAGAVEIGGEAARVTNGRGALRSNRKLWASLLLGVAAGLYVTRRSR